MRSIKVSFRNEICALTLVVLVPLTSCAASADSACSTSEAKDAENAVASIRSFGEFREAYRRYSHCDDGSVAEGFSEASTSIVVSQWGDIRNIDSELGLDSHLRNFFIKHVDATAPLERLGEIERLSGASCPKESELLCAEISAAAKRALRDAAE